VHAARYTAAMKSHVKSAVWAGVIAAISGVVIAGAPRGLAVLALPSLPRIFPGGLGPSIEGTPRPTSVALHLLTFAVGFPYAGLARW
jgi:hypothetical protein